MYLDGPLAGRTAMYGWWRSQDVPELITARVGTVYARGRHGLTKSDGLGNALVEREGREVQYQRTPKGYRFVADGAWPKEFPF